MPPSGLALGTLFALGVVRACAAPPAAHSGAADPHAASSSPSAPTATSAAPAASSAVAAAGPPALPLVTPAVSSDDDKLAFLRQVCEVAIHRDRSGKTDALGCSCCPPFDENGCPPKPGTRAAKSADAVSRLDTLVLGGFTRAGAGEAAASFQGCESHAGNYGGTALYGHALDARAGWKQLQYLSGFHPDSCFAVRGTDGRDRLVCDRSDAHQTISERYLLTHDFSEPDFADADLLALVERDDSCVSAVTLPAGWWMVQADLRSYEMAMRDGGPALVAHVDFAKVVPDSRYLAACGKATRTQSDADTKAAQALLPPPQPHELVFAFDGSTFKLAPSSVALKKEIDTAFDRGP